MIEVYGIESEKLQLLHQAPVFDVIEHINSYKKEVDPTSTLLVLTSDLNLFTLRFCPRSATIITTASISLHQIGARPADYVQTSIVDPHGRCVILHALNGILHVIPLVSDCFPQSKHLDPTLSKRRRANVSTGLLNPSKGSHPNHNDPHAEIYRSFQLRLNEVNVHALNFAALPSTYPPILLIVYSNHLGDRVLRSRKVDLSAANCDHDFFQSYTCRDPVTSMIIPFSFNTHDPETVTPQDVGAILVGEESTELIRFAAQPTHTTSGKGKAKATGTTPGQRKQLPDQSTVVVSSTKLPLGAYTCFCALDELPHSWLLGDLYGNLIVLSLQQSPTSSTISLNFRHIGHVPSPEALVYISNRLVFLASHYGDSQLLRIPSSLFPGGDTTPPPPEVITTFINLAPISDFCVTQDRQSLVNQLVTCSGAYRDGSLRVIKNGKGFRDAGCLDLDGVQRLWSLRSSSHTSSIDDFDDLLILSCADCTLFMALNENGSVEQVEQFNGFRADVPTLLCGNMKDIYLPDCRYSLQVTSNQVIAGQECIWEPRSGTSASTACMGPTTCIVSLKRQIFTLQLKNGSFLELGTCDFSNDVSSLAIDPNENFIAVGQWVTNLVEIISISSQSRICHIKTGSDFLVNSLLITGIENQEFNRYQLIIGMGDGRMMNAALDARGMLLHNHPPRTTPLGIRPIEFYSMSDEKGPFVWANSDQPSIISPSKNSDRLTPTPVTVPGDWVTCATGLHTRHFPNSIVLAFRDEIRIGRLDNDAKMNVVKVALGTEQPRRIAHSTDMRAYGVLCVRLELDQESGVLHRKGSFKILDDETFELLYDFRLLTFEQGSSLAVMKLGNAMIEHFVVGTGWIKSCETEAKTGRILAIRDMGSKSPDLPVKRDFRLTHVGKLSGSVGGLGALPGGMFVASANAFVHAFGIKESTEGSQSSVESGGEGQGEDEVDGTFKILDTWGGGFVSQTVVTAGSKVLVGDLYKSVVLLEFDEEHLELNVKARDFSAMSVRPIGIVSDREFIAADGEFNLFTLHHRKIPLSPESEAKDQHSIPGAKRSRAIESVESPCDDEDDEALDSEVNHDSPSVRHYGDDDDLQQAGAFHLGENVNHFRAGSLIPSHIESSMIANTKLIFVTSTGGVGLVAKLNSKQIIHKLATFQSYLSKVSRSVGNLDHAAHRAFKTKSRKLESSGFLDGDFLESCLELPEADSQDLKNKILKHVSGEDVGPQEEDEGVLNGHERRAERPFIDYDEILGYLEELGRLY